MDEKTLNQIAELRAAYVADLPSKLDKIVEVAQQSFDSSRDRDYDTLFTLYRLVHNLAGSSGMHGLVELSDRARAFELFVQPFAERKIELDDNEQYRFYGHIDRLRESIKNI